MADKDLYAALGVPKTATAADIKKAYRKLARELHPDRNPGNKKAEERFKDVSYANDVLSDPKTRVLYDEFGTMALREGFDVEAARRYKAAAASMGGGGPGNLQDLIDSLQNGGGGGVDLDSLFGGSALDQIFGAARGRRAGRRPMRGSDIGADVQVTLPEALRGTERELTLTVPGAREPKKLRTRLPAGVVDGEKVRLRGQGAEGRDGGPAGDLVLTVRVAPHAVLRRDGNDLHVELPVTVGEAMRGAKIALPTLDGEITLRVPPRTQNGATLRVRGRGAPRRGGGEPGDLLVHVAVQLPVDAPPGAIEDALDSMEKMYSAGIRDKLAL